MRVLLVVSSDRLAGTERHIADLSRGLRQAGVDAEVVCLAGGQGLAANLRDSGVPVHPLRLAGAGIVPSTVALARLARDFDVLHSHLTRATVAAVFAGLLSGRPVVETRHFLVMAYETRGRTGRHAGRLVRSVLARRLALTIAPSEAARIRAKGPTALVPHGIEPRRVEARAAGGGRFVTVGRLDADRNCGLLIRAFAAAAPRLPVTARLVVVGDGTLRSDLERLAQELGVAGQVDFFGWLDDPTSRLDAADVYLAAPFLPVPESFGLSLLEAMRAGLPVIAEPGGGASDLVQPGVTGLLVAPQPSAWASAMVSLATDCSMAAAMGAAGRLRAEREFSFDDMIAGTIDAYRSVVKSRSHGAFMRSASVSE